jgi:hypothetical protein
MNVPIHRLVLVITDNAPVLNSENAGLIALCKEDPTFPDFS